MKKTDKTAITAALFAAAMGAAAMGAAAAGGGSKDISVIAHREGHQAAHGMADKTDGIAAGLQFCCDVLYSGQPLFASAFPKFSN